MDRVLYHRKAVKGLRKLPARVAKRFRRAFEDIANRREHELDISKLAGREGYRIRIGGYRAIYEITDDGVVKVLVMSIGPRGDVYK